MGKNEVTSALAEKAGISESQAKVVLDSFIAIVYQTLKNGEKVTLPGFGVFERRHRPARTARNPRTGEAIQVAAKEAPAFKPGAQFKKEVA